MTIKGTPYGHEHAVIEADNGWAAWKDGCPHCGFNEPEDPPMALTCPDCGRLGCDECIPGGRGCPCEECVLDS